MREGFGILTDNFEDIDHREKQEVSQHKSLCTPSRSNDDFLNISKRSHYTEAGDDISHHYSYRGMWRKGVKQGFGIETYDIEEVEKLIEHPYTTKSESSKTPTVKVSQVTYLETKYSGFFVNNEKSGEGCVELRDREYNVVGWYLGRFEFGVRHGIGREVLVQTEQDTPRRSPEKFIITPHVFNKGNMVPFFNAKSEYVDDILTNIDFFGFMS